MALPCGCDPTYEGGYGDEGRQARYSMESWCALHAGAALMFRFIETLRWAPHGIEGTMTVDDWAAEALKLLGALGLAEEEAP